MTADQVSFTFDGTPMRARRGQTIGAALISGGVTAWRKTRAAGRPRGLFCGIGVCFDCLVDVNEDRSVRACLVQVAEGDTVRTSRSLVPFQGDDRPDPSADADRPSPRSDRPGGAALADVAVVGAGPAGMAAALAAADLGCAVTLVDSGPAVGGQIYRQSWPPAASERLPRRLRRVTTHSRVRHMPGTTVWHAEVCEGEPGPRQRPGDCPAGAPADEASRGTGFLLRLADAAGRARVPGTLHARAVVIATGSCELVLPFPGWDLPGVTTVGAAQALLKSQGITVGSRVLVAGSGPLLLPAAAGLAGAGVRVVAVLEATPARAAAARAAGLARYPAKVREAAGYAAVLARHRVPVLTGRAVVACRGPDRVRQATVSRIDRDWRPVPGTARRVSVDAVHVSFGFSPALELTRLLGCADAPHPARPTAAAWHDDDMATSVPGVFAAGEVTGIGGADLAELEGYLAGAAAARHLGRADAAAYATRTRRVREALPQARRFADLLDDLYPFRAGWLDWPEPGTIACRCEEVPWRAIGDGVAAGALDVRSVKGVTRCGMGYCQGRVCGPMLQAAVAETAGLPLARAGDLHARPVAAPVTLGTIAAAAGDSAGGHGGQGLPAQW